LGARELAEIIGSKKKVMFIGITCGLSAPFVAGQLEYAMSRADTTTVLMGFNPVHLSRNGEIELWKERKGDSDNRSFRDVATKLASIQGPHHIILNPVVGPEPVTGSSRMKVIDYAYLSIVQSFDQLLLFVSYYCIGW
jgi:N-acetylmuramic acid 6-phosphate (MurNAc-6-P) etherase